MMRIYILALLTAALTAVAPASAQTELSGSIAGMTMTGGSYKLVGNLTTSATINVTGTVTLDLNGFVLKRSGSGHAFSIDQGHFTIIDSNPTKANTVSGVTGTISGGVITGSGGDRGGIIWFDGGGFNLNGGTLVGGNTEKGSYFEGNNEPTYACGGAVYVNNGVFTMDGGDIAYCQTNSTYGSRKGGAVFIDGANGCTPKFVLKGDSRIYGCKSARGGAVYVHTTSDVTDLENNKGYFVMEGGVIEDCTADLGGAVMISGGSLFEMTGGEIRNNESTAGKANQYWGGGGIFIHYAAGPSGVVGRFDMYGGKITGNITDAHGCGIHSNGTVNLYGGEISGNHPAGWEEDELFQEGECVYGGGIYMYEYAGYPAKLTMNGASAKISDNVAACGGGVYLKDGADFEFNSGMIAENRALTVWAEEDGKDDLNNNVGTPKINGGGGVFVSTGCTFDMGGSASMTGNKTSGYGNAVHSQGTFTMSGGSIEHNVPSDWQEGVGYTQNTHGGGVCIAALAGKAQSVFTLSGDARISDNVGASGGGVMVWNNARFIMNGGTMSGNRALGLNGLGNGGAVYVNSTTSAFDFNGGAINGNSSLRYGGAININQGSTLNLTGGTIHGNTSNYGGGVSQEQGECSMTIRQDITLSGNTAAYDGGGLFIEMGTVVLDGCIIKDNNAETGNGGGVALKAARVEGSINMTVSNQADISSNAAGGNGGGIALHLGPADAASWGERQSIHVNLLSGDIKANTASSGGALHIYADPSYGTATMTVGTAELNGNKVSDKGGSIYITGSLTVTGKLTVKDNFAGNEAGAILVAGGDFSIADCEISGNKAGYDADGNIVNAAANGGAISITDGAVTIAKGQISNNISTGYGGGLYVANTGSSKNVKLLGGGVFEYNTASHGGGLYVSGDIIMEFQGSVAFNTARCGGGVLLNGADLTIKGGLIRNNRAVPDINDPDAADALTKPETGYLLDFTELSGIGGGIYLSTASTLQFDISSELGVYENDATWGADDIFANGNGTSVTLPDVVSMTLTGYRVPTTELYWAEDYITDDTRYDEGSYIMSTAWSQKNDRYDDAIMDPSKSIYRIDYASFTWPWTKYLCLELGYAFVIVDVVKQGMKTGESAVIVFTPAKNKVAEGVYEVAAGEKPYVTVIFVGEGTGKDVTRQVALPSGWWEIKEDPAWSWTYEGEGPYYNEVLDPDKIVEVTLEKLDSEGKLTYIFRNSAGSDIPESAESVVVNRMNSPL